MLSCAEITEEPNDNDIVVIGHECSFLCLLYAKDEDRKEDMFGTDVTWPKKCLLANKESQVHQRFLELGLWKSY